LHKEFAASLRPINLNKMGAKMDTVTKISSEAVPSEANNLFITALAVTCGLALVVCVCIATNGLDMSPGFF
jgi:hypothetical protein